MSVGSNFFKMKNILKWKCRIKVTSSDWVYKFQQRSLELMCWWVFEAVKSSRCFPLVQRNSIVWLLQASTLQNRKIRGHASLLELKVDFVFSHHLFPPPIFLWMKARSSWDAQWILTWHDPCLGFQSDVFKSKILIHKTWTSHLFRAKNTDQGGKTRFWNLPLEDLTARRPCS